MIFFISDYEIKILESGKAIIGVDEVGRGAMFGDICVGFAILYPDYLDYYKTIQIDDSKKLTEKQREEIYENVAQSDKIGKITSFAFPKKDLNTAFENACAKGLVYAYHIGMFECKHFDCKMITDFGLKRFFFGKEIEEHVKGDSKFLCVALASIFAKVDRDRRMNELATEYPWFELDKNKGYCTKKHMEAVAKYGLSESHRKFYKNLKPFVK